MPIDPSIPLGIRPAQIAPLQIQTPLERYGKMLTLRNLMTQGQLGQMNIEQTRLENERLQREAQEQQSLGSWMQQNQQRPDLTPQEIVAAHPNPTGIKFATAWSAQQTGALTQHKAFLDNAFEEAKTDDRIYNSVNPKDPQSKYAALAELVRLKRISGDQAAQIAALPEADFANIQQRAAASSLDRLQRIEAEKKAIELRIAKVTESSATQGAIAEGAEKQAKSLREELATAGQTAPDNQDEWSRWRATFSERAQQLIPPTFSPRARGVVETLGIPPKRATPGVDVPYAPDVAAQRIQEREAQGRAAAQMQIGVQRSLNQPLIDQSNADPTGNFYRNLPPEKQTAIAPYVTNPNAFAKALSDSELTKLNRLQDAVNAANALKTALGNPQFSSHLGPVSSLTQYWPGSTDTLTMKAKIDLVRQVIGKGIEEGVLRKEDEEKYKAILPTMSDRFPVANAKIDQLFTLLQTNMRTYAQQLVGSGRQLPANVTLQNTGGGQTNATVKMKAPNGQISDVPADQVEHYKSKGAVVIGN